jgi:hypothetical protein
MPVSMLLCAESAARWAEPLASILSVLARDADFTRGPLRLMRFAITLTLQQWTARRTISCATVLRLNF